MSNVVTIGSRSIGPGQPVYVIAEIGLNHNGDIEIAKKLIDVAKLSGCDAVKFQKRTPELSCPASQRDVMRETPWGIMTYLDYRRRVEFGEEQYAQIDEYCRKVGIDWFASCWDEPSVDVIERFNPVCHKIASASLTDDSLLRKIDATGRPIILSTGMSEDQQIRSAIKLLDKSRLVLCHTTSAYPCKPDELNLRCIQWLADQFNVPVGYSGHEVGLQATYAAVAIGACVVERHITLDRAMWGSDQAASVEPAGLIRLVRDIRIIERAMGDGQKKVYESEKPVIARLRRTASPEQIFVQQEQLLQSNRTLRDRHAGQRCFIVATGPSISKQDLRLLQGETCIGLSNLFVHADYSKIAPKYHCIAPFHKPITEEGWQTWMDELAAKSGNAELFFGVRDHDRNMQNGRFLDRSAHFLSFSGKASAEQICGLGIDLTRTMPWPQSVTIMALYAAVYMGFSDIYLLGCDHDWVMKINQSSHFYDERQHALNRSGYNEWHNHAMDEVCKSYLRLWEQYRAVKQAADSRGTRIFNATIGGLLDVFPRISLESAIAPQSQRAAA